jgi:hypothetical protein
MKIKKNTFSTLVLELFFPSIANCRKLKIQKNPKTDFPKCPALSIVYRTVLRPKNKTSALFFCPLAINLNPLEEKKLTDKRYLIR